MDDGRAPTPDDVLDRVADPLRRRVVYHVSSMIVAAILALAALDGLDVLPVVGVDSAVARAHDPHGRTLAVEYPRLTRPALAVPLRIVIDGLADREEVAVAIDRSYLGMFDHNAVFPTPESQRSIEPWVVWDYVAEGPTLTIDIDSRTSPAVHAGMTGHVALLDEANRPILVVDLTTRVMP